MEVLCLNLSEKLITLIKHIWEIIAWQISDNDLLAHSTKGYVWDLRDNKHKTLKIKPEIFYLFL